MQSSSRAETSGSEKTLTYAEALARAAALVPVLRERAAEAEALRRVPDASIRDLHESGLFRILQPRRVGGSELPFRAIIDVPAVLARGCGSTAWVFANLAAHHWMAAMWPSQAQDEIWGADPDVLIGSALIFPSGRAQKVPGGFKLSGRWAFSSGVDPSAWNMIGAILRDEESGHSNSYIFILPAGDYEVIDTWHVSGLRGTGSKDVAVKDVFVPAHRGLNTDQLAGGKTPGAEVNPAALYRLPMRSFSAHCLAGVPLGIAEGVVESFTQSMRTRLGTYTGKNLADFTTIQMRIAEASAMTDAARALLHRDCEEATGIAEAGKVPGIDRKTLYRRDAAFSATLATRAVDMLFTAAGGGAIYDSNALQRSFRDVHAANAHFGLSWDVNGAMFGRVALGLTPRRSALGRPADRPLIWCAEARCSGDGNLPEEIFGSHLADVQSTTAEGFNVRDLRGALGTFATGVTIITTRSRSGDMVGMTANSFTSVSLDPPLVLWSASLYATSLVAFQECTHFVINILAHDQIPLSNRFAKSHEDKFAEVDHVIPECGAPVIIGSAAHFECRNEYRHYGGDHIIFIGHVERYAYTDKPTLMFSRGKYIQGAPLAAP